MRIGHRGNSFINLSTPEAIKQTLWYINCQLDVWWSYTIYGLHNEIHGHKRQHQRYYQRKLCSWISRRNRIKSQFPELFI